MNVLQEIQDWYARQCDGEWEHQYGVQIESLDNPGWLVRIDLIGTRLDAIEFAPISQGVAEGGFSEGPNWLHCYVEDGVFHGAGDESRLEEILQTFLAWDGESGS